MEKKNNRMNIDDHIVTYTYYLVHNAQRCMEVMSKVIKKLNLDGPDYTPEQKRSLKRDLGFTSDAVYNLGQAQEAFRKFVRSVGVVEQELDNRAVVVEYDRAQSVCLDLMAIDLVYLSLTQHMGDSKNREKIHRYLKKFNWNTDGLESLYNTLVEDSDSLLKDYKTHSTMEGRS